MTFKTRPSLIARLKNCADDGAWRDFVESYQAFICKVATEAGARRDTLADMAQEVFLTVLRVLPRFTYDPARGRFRHWLACVVRSRCVDAVRRQRRDRTTRRHLVLNGPTAQTSSDDDGPEFELKRALESVRRSARPESWQCFQQHALEGRRAADVARELQTTENAVYLNSTRLFRRIQAECRRQTGAEANL